MGKHTVSAHDPVRGHSRSGYFQEVALQPGESPSGNRAGDVRGGNNSRHSPMSMAENTSGARSNDGSIAQRKTGAGEGCARYFAESPPALFASTEGRVQEGRTSFPDTVQWVNGEGELEGRVRQLNPGQYAIIAFSSPYCVACRAYKTDLERFAKESGGQYLFFITEDEGLFRKYGISQVPHVLVLDARGDVHPICDRGHVLDEMFHVGEPVVQRMKNVRDGVREGNVSPSINCYATLAKTLTSDEAAEEGKSLRQMLQRGNEAAGRFAIASYASLLPKLTPEDAAREAGGVRLLFQDKVERVSRFAFETYPTVLPQLTSDGVAKEAAALRLLFADAHLSIRTFASSTYCRTIAGRLAPDGVAKEAEALRLMFRHDDVSVRHLAIFAYPFLRSRMTPEEVKKGVEALRLLAGEDPSSEVREDAKWAIMLLEERSTGRILP